MANDIIRGNDGSALVPWAASAFCSITFDQAPGPYDDDACPTCGSVNMDDLPPMDVRDAMDVLDHLWDDE